MVSVLPEVEPTRETPTRAPRWRVSVGVLVVLALIVAAGAGGWLRGGGTTTVVSANNSAAAAQARYRALAQPVNARCGGNATTPISESNWQQDARGQAACGAALASFAVALRSSQWPVGAAIPISSLITAVDNHARWAERRGAASSWTETMAIIDQLLAQRPGVYLTTVYAATDARNVLGMIGGPDPLV